MTRPTLIIPVIVGFLLWGAADPGLAQDSTLKASEAPASGSCADVPPRDAAFFAGLPGTPQARQEATAAASASPASPTPFALPEGTPADAATVADVTMLYEQLVACLNTGDFLRVYALYSDAYLTENFSAEVLTTLEATPVPSDASAQTTLGGVLDVRMLDDDRIAALITTRNEGSGEVLLFAILRRDEDRLRIDDEQVVASTPPATPIPGTPVG